MFRILLFFLGISPTLLFAQPLKPTETEAAVHLIFKHIDGNLKPNERIVFVAVTTEKVYEVWTNEKGELDILLPEGDKYIIKIEDIVKDKKFHEFEIFSAPGKQNVDLILTYTPPTSMTLENIFFDTNKFELRPESFPELDKLYEYLRKNKYVRIEIAGHTDNVGKPEDNLLLSTNRAKSVLRYLVQKGIDPRRLSAKGYGDTSPVADNNTPQGRQENRRVEVYFKED